MTYQGHTLKAHLRYRTTKPLSDSTPDFLALLLTPLKVVNQNIEQVTALSASSPMFPSTTAGLATNPHFDRQQMAHCRSSTC
ncbi:MAG: hypothetical protein IPP36_10855 [Nitrosomonadales bacterium]|nr:hypothetical protein [Nitrosomonadales bacterium]